MNLLLIITSAWLTLLLLGAVFTTLNIGKPRPPYTPGLAVMTWLFFFIAVLVVFGVIR